MFKKLITVAERHNCDIVVLKKILADYVEKWNNEYKNLFTLKAPDWYDNFGMVRLVLFAASNKIPEAASNKTQGAASNKKEEELHIVLNLNEKEIRVLAEIPEVIDIYSYTLETEIKKKLKEVIKITEKKSYTDSIL